MKNLLALQKAFQARLLDSNENNILSYVVATKQPSHKQRINIYSDGYSARLMEALNDNYSQLAIYMGQNAFDKMAKAYLDKYPSNFRAIQLFGDKLATFLTEYKPQQPNIAQLAKFEWAIGKTFDAPDVQTLGIHDLKQINATLWAKMKFTFHPSVSLLDFDYNISAIWDGLLNNQRKRSSKLKIPQSIIFWRHNLETLYRIVPKHEADALKVADQSFAKICEVLCQYYDEQSVANEALSLLIKWLNAGLITKIDISKSTDCF